MIDDDEQGDHFEVCGVAARAAILKAQGKEPRPSGGVPGVHRLTPGLEADRRVHSQFCLDNARLEGFEPDEELREVLRLWVKSEIPDDLLMQWVNCEISKAELLKQVLR